MFKTVAAKIAHNSMIPALAGNFSRLQPLQEVIAAEKLVLQSYALGPVQTALISDPLSFQSPGT